MTSHFLPACEVTFMKNTIFMQKVMHVLYAEQVCKNDDAIKVLLQYNVYLQTDNA